MKKLLLSMGALALSLGAFAQVENGQYCIKNVEMGTFLNSGHSWGTAAVIKSEGRVFEIINNPDGTCKVKSSLGYWKGGDETFIDGSEGDAGNFEFVKKGDKYVIKHDGKFFAPNEKFDFKDGDWWNWEKACHQDIQWTIKHVDEAEAALWEVISLEDMKKSLLSATPEAPVDASFLIKAHNMAKNDSENLTAWEWTKNGEKAEVLTPDPNWIYGDGDAWAHQDTYAFCINDKNDNELADSEDVVKQEVEGLPAGKYNIVYRVVNQNNTGFELDVNGTKCPVVDFAELDLWYHPAADALKTGEKTEEVTVGDDGKLTIKMTKQAKAGVQNRFAFKSFKLLAKSVKTSGVENIAVDADENAPVEYYNLQGVRVSNPDKGIYIVRQGSNVTKKVIR